ncbi:MAG: hypothetical protein ABSD88_18795 [Candidatus Korobacteraceae bacterium]
MPKLFCLPMLALLALSVTAIAQGPAGKSGAAVHAAEEEQQCVPFTEALSKVGQTACIEGTVVGVYVTRLGVTYLDFCPDFRNCAFTVAVLPSGTRGIANLKTLKGADIRITGKVKKRGHSAEMTWEKEGQLLVAYSEPPPEPEPRKKKGKKSIAKPGPAAP